MLLYAKKFAEDNFNAKTIYGDTDSIMICFPDIIKDTMSDLEKI
jgi:DNA polymerase elongation subunit (family B)